MSSPTADVFVTQLGNSDKILDQRYAHEPWSTSVEKDLKGSDLGPRILNKEET